MKDEKGKKSLFARLNEGKKTKKNACCCNFEVEEIPQDQEKRNEEKDPKGKGNSCC